jgi:hypothetical protein
MKKHFRFSVMAALAAFAFAACEEVPELPYNPEGGEEDDTTEIGGVKTLPYSESFSSSLGDWTNQTTSGEGAWINDYSTAKATGYDNASKVTTAGTYYLVSPEISLEGVTEAHASFEYILRYNKADENQKMLISADYTDDATTATWTVLSEKHTEGRDWTTFESADINIPAEYMGKLIRIAFYYNTNDVSGSTWEVRNFAIAEGKATEGGNNEEEKPDTPGADIPDGESLLTNCSFENWSGGKPTGWAGVSSNATIKQSTDAHQGVYSVLVEGASTNKRFTSGTVTLKAGTYGIGAYLKQSGDAAGKFRLGYVKLTNGAVANTSTDYIYITEPASVSSEWEQATCTFELTEDTELALIIMNSKNGNGNAILVDDVTLTTEDGGLIEGGNEGGEEEEPGDVTYTGKYVKVTEFTEAGTYLLVAGDQAFTQLDANKTYGYMPAATVSISNGEIAASATTEAAKLTITSTDGGYTLQDASTRYIYMKGTYNSFNIGTTAEESYVWTITANGDETFSVTNADMSKTIMYDTQYSSYGSYPEKTDTRLYVNIYKYIAE